MEVYLGLSGQTYNIGDALSDEAVGAEGSICEIIGNTTLVAKIYHDDMAESESAELESKLKLMINKRIVETQGVFSIAWPKDLLYRSINGKKIFSGYTMRKVSASYNLSDLTHHNPDDPDPDPNGIDGYITWKEFIQAAYNLSRLVEYLHKNGIEIGDFNERNFLFDETTGGFDLIDCGTYGIFDTKTLKTIYPCRYSMPKYSAPEKLLGLDISNPKSTDCFYLAIHIFHLLMQNSEPFGYKENSDGNPISKLHEHIANGDCIYVRSIPGKVLRKHSIKPGVLPDDILEAFNRTFNYTRDNIVSNISNRTTASEWCEVLEPYLTDESRIIRCSAKKEHVYSAHLTECPWCNPSSVSDIPFEKRINSSTGQIQHGGDGANVIGLNDPCPCGSGKKYKNCCGKKEESDTSITNSKLAEACDILAKTMSLGDDYSISKPVNEKNILITLNGIRKIEDFFKIENINDPQNEQIEKGIREAICRKVQNQEDSDKQAAQKVQALIDAIGKVTYTENCRKKISAARIAFSNLTVPQRMLVQTDKLSKAESEYAALKNKAENSKKSKRTILTVCAAIAVCIIGVIVFNIVSNHNKPTALTEKFIASAKPGDEFILGKYEQDNDLINGQEDIEWVVLGNDNGTITAMSKYCLEDMPFNDASIDTPTNWADSTIREWLNTDFYKSAFSDEEKSMLKLSHLSNPGNSYFNIDGGDDTDDYVFLVGRDTLETYYSDLKLGAVEMSWDGVEETMTVGMSDQTEYEPLRAQYTDYAKQKYIEAEPQVDYDSVEKEYGENSCFWWTRATGDANYSMFQIINSGGAMSVPAKANCGIRPIICIEADEKSAQLQNEQSGNTAEQDYIANNIEALNSGMNQGNYRQMIFGNKAVYCLNNDGSVTVYAVDQEIGQEMQSVYSTWKDIASITMISNTSWYNESLIGIKTDGTVIAPDGARVYQGDIDVSDWTNIVQINASNAETVLALTSDGTVLCTPTTRNYDGSPIFSDGLDGLTGCQKLVSVETKDVDVLGLSSSGTIVAPSTEYAPYAYYHDDWTTHYLGWSNLKDISICSSGTDLFGLTQSGNVLYGGVFGYSGELDFDEDEISSLSDIKAISAGGRHLVALRSDGTVFAAGSNNYGQCDVSSWKDIVRIEAYGNTTVGYGPDGKVYYAGYNCLETALNKLKSSKLQVTARLKGETEWTDVIHANVGDEVEFQIEYINLQTDSVNDVMIRDVLPTNIQYVEGTTYLFNSNYKDGVLLKDDTVTTTGINIGSYSENGNAYVRFTGKVVNSNLAVGDNQLVNWASATVTNTVYKDDVSIMVNMSD